MSENKNNSQQDDVFIDITANSDKIMENMNELDLEIAAYRKTINTMITNLEKLVPIIQSNKIDAPATFIKIITPMRINIENMLPQLHDLVDNLEYMQVKDYQEVKAQINHIEEDLLPPIINYIDNYKAE